MAVKKWMAGAVKRPGALTRKAKAAKMSLNQYCSGQHYQGLSTLSKQQCNFYKRTQQVRKGK